ncbi:hypothetical protein OUZ56_025569 [Daphnia magna]|uniref:Uncharacterized protein n=1 Tax=Daphnia magna TaxID=35525 RepID=A0ABQ9ZK85_9CRUS|nr:hypothetical protein OUZ56_025569 [Daphnia magna]
MVKHKSTVLHYAAKYGNDGLAWAACRKESHVDINKKTIPGNHTALHLATIYRQINETFVTGTNHEITQLTETGKACWKTGNT